MTENNEQVLRMYGSPSTHDRLDWPWAVTRLTQARFYWVSATTDGYPHPRPVWGVWLDDALHLSIGTPQIRLRLPADPRLTVHSGDGNDVVIVHGIGSLTDPATGQGAGDDAADRAVATYNRKYDYDYDVAQYGPFTVINPMAVLAWHAAGPDGRDGFRGTGKWTFNR